MKTCTAWPVDCTRRVGSSPPCRKDSDEPISTLRKHRHKMNYILSTFNMVSRPLHLGTRDKLKESEK